MKLSEKIEQLKLKQGDPVSRTVEAHNNLVDVVLELIKHIPNLPHEWEAGFPDEGVL